jgi:Uma2 family endonuclease
MAVAQQISDQEFERFVLSGVEGTWELHAGRLMEKPALDGIRGTVVTRLARQLLAQLDAAEYEVRVNDGYVRATRDTILVPDLFVAPAAPDQLNSVRTTSHFRTEPMPLLVEVWTPDRDCGDADARILTYQQRGDREIWLIRPDDRTLTTWVRRLDGTYAETIYQSGAPWPAVGVSITPGRDGRYHA